MRTQGLVRQLQCGYVLSRQVAITITSTRNFESSVCVVCNLSVQTTTQTLRTIRMMARSHLPYLDHKLRLRSWLHGSMPQLLRGKVLHLKPARNSCRRVWYIDISIRYLIPPSHYTNIFIFRPRQTVCLRHYNVCISMCVQHHVPIPLHAYNTIWYHSFIHSNSQMMKMQ